MERVPKAIESATPRVVPRLVEELLRTKTAPEIAAYIKAAVPGLPKPPPAPLRSGADSYDKAPEWLLNALNDHIVKWATQPNPAAIETAKAQLHHRAALEKAEREHAASCYSLYLQADALSVLLFESIKKELLKYSSVNGGDERSRELGTLEKTFPIGELEKLFQVQIQVVFFPRGFNVHAATTTPYGELRLYKESRAGECRAAVRHVSDEALKIQYIIAFLEIIGNGQLGKRIASLPPPTSILPDGLL